MGVQKSDLCDLEGVVHEERESSILFSVTGERREAVWLPKSQIEVEGPDPSGKATVTLPQWLAEDRRLV